MCSQSLFKLKPDFDLVLRDILLAFDHGSNNHNQVFCPFGVFLCM